MNIGSRNTDAELLRDILRCYEENYRHPNLQPFTITRHHTLEPILTSSIFDSIKHPEVLKPGVYAHYDHAGTLIYIGESQNPSSRNLTHLKNAKKFDRRPPPCIDLITVIELWERFSLEAFLQSKVPHYRSRWDEWTKREQEWAKGIR